MKLLFSTAGKLNSKWLHTERGEEKKKRRERKRERLTNFNSVFTINCRDYPGGIMDKILVLCIRN